MSLSPPSSEPDIPPVPDTPPVVDDDWLHHFCKFASSKSNTEIQAIFGRILSGEVLQPGKFSLFTIEILARLDQYTANAFEYAASHAIIISDNWNPIVISIIDSDRIRINGIVDIDAIMHLESCGLIQSVGMSQIDPIGFAKLPPSTLGGAASVVWSSGE